MLLNKHDKMLDVIFVNKFKVCILHTVITFHSLTRHDLILFRLCQASIVMKECLKYIDIASAVRCEIFLG